MIEVFRCKTWEFGIVFVKVLILIWNFLLKNIQDIYSFFGFLLDFREMKVRYDTEIIKNAASKMFGNDGK